MNNIKRFMKNRKAISPIFATLILIAIAVIAGVVVYMFTSGTLSTMTNGGTAGQERVAVQGASLDTAGTTITVYAQNTGPTGTSDVTVNGLIIKDANGNTVQTATSLAHTALAQGALVGVTGSITKLPAGSYTVTVSSAKGGAFVSSSFIAPP